MSIGEKFATRNEVEQLRRKLQRVLGSITIIQRGPDVELINQFTDLIDVPSSYAAAGNFAVRVNNTVDALEFAELKGTTNQIYITPHAADYVFSLPQDIHTAATPTFAGMYLTSASAAPFLKLTNESDTARDPIIQWAVGATPVTKFTMGVDDSDADDAFRLDKGAVLGADLVLYSGNKNTIFGEGAFLNISIEDVENNVILGYRASQGTGVSDIGDGNVIIGADAALYTESGSYDNVILGYEAIQSLCDSSYGNLIAGAHSGQGAGGGLTRSVLLGYYANTENDTDNVIAIGANVSNIYGNTCKIGRSWDETDPLPVFIGSGVPLAEYKLDLWHAGTAKGITNLVRLVNPITAADMDGTGTGLLLGLRAYEVGAGTYYDAGQIVAVAETDWSALDINSIDSYLGFYTSLNGVLAEKIRINSAGQLISNLAIGTAPFVVTSTTAVTNLNADLLDGSHAAAFEPALGNPGTTGWVLSSTDAGVRSWIPAGGALALDDLTDVNAPAPNDNDVLSWDTATSKWIPVAGGGGALALDDLTDVDAAAPNDDDIIRFDTASGLWKHEALPAGGAHDLLSATHGDTAAAAVVRGDIIIGSAAAPNTKWTRLAVGAAGTYLAGSATEPSWATLNQAAVAGLTTADGPTFAHLHFGQLLSSVASNINVGGGLPSRTTGNYDNAVGAEAQYVLTEGSFNNAFGYFTQRSLTTGTNDNAFGHAAQRWLTSGQSDNAFGYQTQDALTTANFDNAFGDEAQGSLTTGESDNAFGHQAQYALLTGHDDNAFGFYAQKAATTAQCCNAVGSYAQYSLTEAYYVNSFGYGAGYSITTASGGLFLGNQAGHYETAANKLFIDNTARANEADGRAKALIYGIFAAATANQYLYLNANVAVSESLTVGGAAVWTAADFTDLGDVPASYVGAGGKVVKVNAGATGLEFVAGGAGVASFNDLDDVPASYVGQAGLFARVKVTEDGLEYAAVAGGGGAPVDAKYIVGAANATLTVEKVKPQLYNNYDVDDTPGSPNAMDDEFDDSSLDGKWTIVNDPAGGNAVSETAYPGYIWLGLPELVTDDFDHLVRIYQAPPAGNGAWSFVIKASVGVQGLESSTDAGEFTGVGVYVGTLADDQLVASIMQYNDANGDYLACRLQGQNDMGVPTFNNPQIVPAGGNYYIRLDKTTANAYTSANTFDMYYSFNGITWYHSGQHSKTFTHACDELGICFRGPKAQGGTPIGYGIVDFFRRTI